MLKKILSAAIGAVLLSSLGAVPAQAAAVKPLRLTQSTISVGRPSAVPGEGCDGNIQFDCGVVTVTATFSGLHGRARPASPLPVLDLDGTVEVTRSYGCATAAGTRLHRYDTRVRETLRLGTRRSTGVRLPARGDTTVGTAYAFLLDAQPGGCPAGTTAMTYATTAKHVRLRLSSTWAPIPSQDFPVRGGARWTGAAPTPVTAPAPARAPIA